MRLIDADKLLQQIDEWLSWDIKLQGEKPPVTVPNKWLKGIKAVVNHKCDTINAIVIPENATGKDVTNSQVLRTIFPDMSWYEVMGEGNMSYVIKVNEQKGTQWERKALTYNAEWGNMPYKGVSE